MKKFIIPNKKRHFFQKRFAITLSFILIILSKSAFCQLSLPNQEDLQKIENYLNNIKNFSANFTQKTQNSVAKGKFYLSRPGKMRVEYNQGAKILIIVNGSVLTYKDLELDEISNISTNTTPASFLTRSNISFAAKDVKITDFKKENNTTSISVVKKNRPEAGIFTLYFQNEPFAFVKMEVEDDLGQKTSITLENRDFPEFLDSDLFVIKNKNLPI